MLAADVVAYGDGGGKAPTFASPVHGRENVVALLMRLTSLARRVGFGVRPVEVNGQPGVVFLDPDGLLISVVSLDIVADQVQTIRSMSNPEKLRHLGPVSNARRLFAERLGGHLPSGVTLGDDER